MVLNVSAQTDSWQGDTGGGDGGDGMKVGFVMKEQLLFFHCFVALLLFVFVLEARWLSLFSTPLSLLPSLPLSTLEQ